MGLRKSPGEPVLATKSDNFNFVPGIHSGRELTPSSCFLMSTHRHAHIYTQINKCEIRRGLQEEGVGPESTRWAVRC